eukprot:CAMPEP_0118940910 /NCGR_PEP_ID=MMETSP1169-20130426/32622_1 /TAXON_ID=36882 /ORGANISM="Pyramimonas obovata, Strain CCMP722" /LENGTH=283 /DNA_ID=CAMNT_0006885537 /DNA_START=509 /DNA_END=1357 /DNA_ORIENTATION=-
MGPYSVRGAGSTTSAAHLAGKRRSQRVLLGNGVRTRTPLKCRAGFQDQDVVKDATDLYQKMPDRVSTDGKEVETKTSENFGEELALESCANLISMTIGNMCAQPDFVVNDIGTIPGENGAPGYYVWLATQRDESAPFGFGKKVEPTEFWQVPEESTLQLAPGLTDEKTLTNFKYAMYLKAERANLSESAVFAFGFMLQSIQLSKSYRLVCGPDKSPVKKIYTLLAPRPLDGGILSLPLVVMAKDQSMQALGCPEDASNTMRAGQKMQKGWRHQDASSGGGGGR